MVPATTWEDESSPGSGRIRLYTNVSTEQIVRSARVTRGALYHHFAGKRDLFGAVAGQIGEEISGRVECAALSAPTTWDGLLAGMDAFLDACLQPDIYRIVVLDGPSVVGWTGWRDKDNDGLGLLTVGLEELVKTGVIERQPVDVLAHLLLGAMSEDKPSRPRPVL